MNDNKENLIQQRKSDYPKGCRVRLIKMHDPYTKLEPGSLGTVSSVDDNGTIFVNWDSGCRLGVVMDEDLCEKVSVKEFRIMDVSEKDVFYGYLNLTNESIDFAEVQNAINEIKCSDESIFQNGDWEIADIIERLPTIWGASFDDNKKDETLYV